VSEIDDVRRIAACTGRELDRVRLERDAARLAAHDLGVEVERLRFKLSQPCGSCHPCLNWSAETMRRLLTDPAVDTPAEAQRAAMGYADDLQALMSGPGPTSAHREEP
jgi:hypothetical protein